MTTRFWCRPIVESSLVEERTSASWSHSPTLLGSLSNRRPSKSCAQPSFDQVFRWTPVPGAQSYRLQIARDEGFFDLAEEWLTGPKTSVRVNGLEPGTYFWRVTALSPTGFEGPPTGDSYFVFVQKHP